MKPINKILLITLLMTPILLIGCDPWSSYPPDDRFGGNLYDGELVWEEVIESAPWVARYRHETTVFDGKLWILGGYGYQGVSKDSYLEDVWFSEDGVTWENTTMDASWGGRSGHAVVTFDNALYLIGGYAVLEAEESTHETNHYTNDVWRSTDGITWVEVPASADFGARAYHEAVVVEVDGTDTIFVIGGRKNGTDYYNDIWKSTDGENWTQVLSSDDKEILGKRAAMATSVVGTKIYIMGGFTEDYEVAEVNKTDWKKIRVFDTVTETMSKADRTGGSYYENRAMMEMVPFDGDLYLFGGVDVRREYNMQYSTFYSTWRYSYGSNDWSLDSAGSGFGPRYGYGAEIFDDGHGEKIWILGGFSSSGPKNDVMTAEMGD